MMTALIDTSFLLAMIFSRDKHHSAAREAAREFKGTRLVPAPVVFEAFYMVATRIHYLRAVQLLDLLRTGAFQIVELTDEDYDRIRVITRDYADAQFDLADAAIMALAERLRMTRVYTFDRHDFPIFRPKHSGSLDLQP